MCNTNDYNSSKNKRKMIKIMMIMILRIAMMMNTMTPTMSEIRVEPAIEISFV